MAGFENFNTHTSTTPQKPLFPTKESGILTKEKSEPISDKKSSQEKFNEELARKKALFDRIHKLETAEKSKEGDPRKWLIALLWGEEKSIYSGIGADRLVAQALDRKYHKAEQKAQTLKKEQGILREKLQVSEELPTKKIDMSDVLSKAKLASLSYVHLKKNEESGEILADDILETDDFPHIGNPEDLSKRKRNPQEKMLGEIIDSRPFQTFKDHFDIEKTPAISADSLALISKSSGKSEELIRLQIEKSFLSEEPISEEVIRYFWLNSCIEEMRKKKRSMDSAPIKSMEKQGFKIFDFFPNSEAQDVDESGLGAVALKDKNGKIHIAIRGTEIGRKDGKADYELTRGRIPLRQTRDLVLFIERVLEKAPKNGKISIEGHSLGGALTQIASIMFRERIENAMTFNSPGGANLEIHPENEENPIVRARFEAYQNFTYPIDNNSVENRIVNVGWVGGISGIKNLGDDAGFTNIDFMGLKKHGINDLINFGEQAVKEDSDKIEIVDLRYQRYMETLKQKNKPSETSPSLTPIRS